MAKNRHCPAFRFCRDDCTDCEHSIRYNQLHGKVKRQKAAIERLAGYNENLQTANVALANELLDAKPEAIKEFAERLNNGRRRYFASDSFWRYVDSLVEEMTEVHHEPSGM